MLLVRDDLRRDVRDGANALSIGVFDGVHGGHRMLIGRMIEEARSRGLGSGVITFHPAPITVVRPDVPFSYLESLERRVELLRETGVDFVSVLPFTSELQQVSAGDFTRLLLEEAGMRLLVVGEDFRLGRGAEGDLERLRALGDEQGFEVLAVPLLATGEDGRISSTRIRDALGGGRMEEVARLLGRPFALRGPVLQGEQRGRTIGYPTLNIGVSADRALPPNGVYVTRAEAARGSYRGVTNIGTRPTFDGTHTTVETHLFDFEGDLYGQVVTVELLHMLRPEQRFEGVGPLIAQIERDAAAAKEWLS